MTIQPAALPLGRAEGEDVLEDALVRDDPGDQRGQHHHPRQRRQQPPPGIGQLQFEMEAVEEFSAQRLARDRRAADWIERARHIAASAVIGRLDGVLMTIGGGQEPAGRSAGVALQPSGRRHHGVGRRGGGGRFRPHPAADLGLENGERARQAHEEQHMAQQQPGPAMQPGHALAHPLAHRRRWQGAHAGCPAAQAPSASSPATSATPASARQGPRARKAQMVTAGAAR